MNGYRKRWRSQVDVLLLRLGDLIGPSLLALSARLIDDVHLIEHPLALGYLIEKMA